MIHQTEIDNLKQSVRIVDVLYSQGHQPAYQSGKELVYLSPLRNEKTPSFHVNPQLNSFKDFGEDAHKGDVIRLVQLMQSMNFYNAVQFLKNWQGQPMPDSFSFSGYTPQEDQEEEAGIKVRNIGPLKHPALIEYLQSRKISTAIGSRYLQEVHYTRKDKYRFGLGFQNDKGGFAIRSKFNIKDATKPAHFSTIPVAATRSANLFEGFFDFLSALEFYQVKQPSRITIVLNSTSMLTRSLDTLRRFDSVNCYLDRDEAGQSALTRLRSEGIQVVDKSDLYDGFKDFNDFLMSK